jgi:membrane associated rhomboid family serine protease
VTSDPTEYTSAPVCYRHSDRHTLLTCSRCGRPICVSCSTDATVGQRCPECLREEGTQKVIPTGPRRSAMAPPATRLFISVAAVVFVASLVPDMRNRLFEALAQANFLVAAGEWWRIFTPVLVHASLMHILFNMWALWILGPQVERGVGTGPFVGLYLASAGMGGVFFYYMGAPGAVAVGASGAIFGLFGIWFNWALRRRNTMSGRALLRQIGFLLAINAAIPFMFPSIAWEAHLGGLITGFLIGELWSRIKGPNARRVRTLAAFAVAALAVILVTL